MAGRKAHPLTKYGRPANRRNDGIPETERGLYRQGFRGDHGLGTLSPEDRRLVEAAAGDVRQKLPDILENLAANEQFGPPPAAPVLGDKYRKKRALELLKKVQLRELREAALEDPWLFLTEILYCEPEQRQHYVESFHEPILMKLANLPSGEDALLLINREARKSFLVIAFVTWLILRDPNIRIKMVCEKLETARMRTHALREIFLARSPRYRKFKEVFPDYLIDSRDELLQSQKWTHPLRTIAYMEPTVFATYLGDSGAGTRCDVMIGDDPWSNSSLTSPEQGAKVMQQWLDLIPLVEMSSFGKYRNTILCVTPWRQYDPTAYILGVAQEGETGKAERPEWAVHPIVHHVLEDPDRPCEACPKWVTEAWPHGHPDFTKGKPPMAPIFTKEIVRQRLSKYRLSPALGEAAFWLQYMVVYRSVAATKFQKEWFRKVGWAHYPQPKRRALVLDDASKDMQAIGQGDFCVAKFGEYDEEGRLLQVGALRSNEWTREQFIREILKWCYAQRWWPTFIVKEKVSVDNFLVDIGRQFNEAGRPVILIPAPRAGLGKKEDMIVSTLQGPYERGEILFGANYPTELFERDRYELMNLGSVSHDDMADATCLFFHPAVRVPATSRLPSGHGEWVTPEVSLYDPLRPPPAAPAAPPAETPWGRAASRTEGSWEKMGFEPDEVTWTPDPQGVSIDAPKDYGPGESIWWNDTDQ